MGSWQWRSGVVFIGGWSCRNCLVRVIARAFSAGFQLVVRCVRLLLVGSSERVMGYIHMIVVVLIGECPCVWAAWR